jgi:hypothetical protein
MHLVGRFKPRTASGILTVTLVVDAPYGGDMECTTGVMDWTAVRR